MGTGSRIPEKRTYSWILVYICAVDCITHIMLYFRMTFFVLDAKNFPVLLTRWSCWQATAPAIILLLGELTTTSTLMRPIYLGMHWVLITGLYAASTKSYLTSAIFFLISTALLVQIYLKICQNCFSCRKVPAINVDSTRICVYLTLFSWTFFPLAFFGVSSGILSYGEGEMVYSIANVVSKVLVTIAVVDGAVDNVQKGKADSILEITSCFERALELSDESAPTYTPEPQPQHFESATIFYSDITSFSIPGSSDGLEKMRRLVEIWQEYERIGLKYNLSLVKTFGDAFMAAFGFDSDSDHASKCVEYTMELQQMLKSFGDLNLDIKFGIASGPVNAINLSSSQTPKYYVVGECAELAKLMQANSKPLRIHIADGTFELLKEREYSIRRDVLAIENYENRTAYYVNGRLYDSHNVSNLDSVRDLQRGAAAIRNRISKDTLFSRSIQSFF